MGTEKGMIEELGRMTLTLLLDRSTLGSAILVRVCVFVFISIGPKNRLSNHRQNIAHLLPVGRSAGHGRCSAECNGWAVHRRTVQPSHQQFCLQHLIIARQRWGCVLMPAFPSARCSCRSFAERNSHSDPLHCIATFSDLMDVFYFLYNHFNTLPANARRPILYHLFRCLQTPHCGVQLRRTLHFDMFMSVIFFTLRFVYMFWLIYKSVIFFQIALPLHDWTTAWLPTWHPEAGLIVVLIGQLQSLWFFQSIFCSWNWY